MSAGLGKSASVCTDDDDVTWDDVDPFTKLGHIRIIVVRRKPDCNYKGELDNCIDIMAVDGFYDGFRLNPIKKKYNRSGTLPTYKEDVEMCEHKINHIFKAMPIGIYELVGEMWSWSSTSWEGEWDGDTEVRNFKIQEVSFDDAISMCEVDEGFYNELARLKEEKQNSWKETYHSEVDVHYMMSRQQIYRNHANVLSRMIEGTYHGRTSFNDSTVEELEACIHMMMLQIDSEKHLERHREEASRIDERVKNVIMDHNRIMDPEF